MPLSNTSIGDTYYTASIVRLNQIIKIINDLTDYNLESSGTVTISNPSKFQGNVSLNVASGLIKGDGGLLSNIRGTAVTSIPNSSLANSTLNFTSSNSSLAIANGAARLGNTVNFTIIISNNINDTSTSNIPSANLVRTAYDLANTAYNTSLDSLTTAGGNTARLNVSTQLTVTGNSRFEGMVDTASANLRSQTLTDAGTISWNLAGGSVSTVTLGGNRTMGAPTNMKVGTYILHVIQDGTGGRDITWNSVFKWSAGVKPPLTTAGGSRDIISFVCDGSNMYGSYLLDVR